MIEQSSAEKLATKRTANAKWRKENPQKHAESGRRWFLANPEKRKAENLVRNELRSRRLTRQPCSVCGAPKTHAHHEDYSKPLDVVWLCPLHHRARHKELKAQSEQVAA